MFYPSHPPLPEIANPVSVMVSLTPSESKRLIAKAVARLPEVLQARQKGWIIIARGTTNAFVAEEIMGLALEHKQEYTRGSVVYGELNANLSREGVSNYVLHDGKIEAVKAMEAIRDFTHCDVFIKGGNAVDPTGEAAVLAGDWEAGTVGYSLPILLARSAHLIVPIGLEKLIPSVALAVPKCGVLRPKYSTGLSCALIPLVNGKVVTEVQSFAIMSGVKATHVASGGFGGSEGAVILVLEGEEAAIEGAFNLVKSIKGEPNLSAPHKVNPPAASVSYDPKALMPSTPVRCARYIGG
jgi:hypothetical protein